jgi:hypothetical protein
MTAMPFQNGSQTLAHLLGMAFHESKLSETNYEFS